MTILLIILGLLVLLPSAAGVVFGGYMALDSKTRSAGLLFALWWVSAVVAALGILLRDPATFAMGLFCFAVSGLALFLKERGPKESARRRVPTAASEMATQENKIREPSEDVPSEDVSGEDAPSEDARNEDVTSEEVSSEDTSGEDTSGEDVRSGGAS